MKQLDLPAGIAYAFHEFPHYAKTGKFYKAGLEGKALAVIPRRDWEEVKDGTELLSLFGHPKVKGQDEISMMTKNGYLYVGFLLEKLDVKPDSLPTTICIRCGSTQIHRTVVSFVPGASAVTALEVPFLEHVNCNDCKMWWEDIFVEPEEQRSFDDVEADEYLHWAGMGLGMGHSMY